MVAVRSVRLYCQTCCRQIKGLFAFGEEMPRDVDIAGRIQKLVAEREHHARELARIDQVLDTIKAMLSGNGSDSATPCTEAPVQRRGQRGRGAYGVTANESVLGFVREQKDPTSREIAAHWANEGRKGGVHNILSQLVKLKKVKRRSLEEGRGSRYELA
jgi:hypothetical protein